MDFYLKDILNILPIDYLIESMLYLFLLVITLSNIYKDKDGDCMTGVTNNGIKLGRLIVDKYISELHRLRCVSNPNSTVTYTDFKENILIVSSTSKSSLGVKYYRSILFSDEFYLKIGTALFENMDGCSLLCIKVINVVTKMKVLLY